MEAYPVRGVLKHDTVSGVSFSHMRDIFTHSYVLVMELTTTWEFDIIEAKKVIADAILVHIG